MTEFCPHLWDTITIGHKGDVYNCCLIQPTKLGNIYTDKLHDTINGPEIIRLRCESLQGKLPCYKDCNLIDKTPLHEMDERYNNPVCKYSDLHTLYVNFGLKCNISCIMCRQRKRYITDKTVLNADVLMRNIDIEPFSDIYLQGGEPLYIDECLKYMNHLAHCRKKYSLLTNGLLIEKEMAAKLAEEAKLVSISLNAATKTTHERVNRGSLWERVLENIQYLKYYREKSASDLLINGRMTLTVGALKEIPQFIANYCKFGFDTINFGYDRETVPPYLEQNPKFASELSRKIISAMAKTDVSKIDTLRLVQLGLLDY